MQRAIHLLSATQLAECIKEKKLLAEEVACNYLARIQNTNPQINALVQMEASQILQQARTIDELIRKKNKRIMAKKLLGVPITIKNTCKVKGFKPDKGCKSLVGDRCQQDATIVSRLRAQGAVIIGLTNVPELSIGYETDNRLYGRTNNPYNVNLSPGGSSGGESAAIAAAFSVVGIGTDASGSLRVPAHNTGVATIKATQGRIPFTGNIPVDSMGLFSQFISFGPMARNVEDLALAVSIMEGPDGCDPHAVPVTLKNYRHLDLSKLKVAYYLDDGISLPHPDVQLTVKLAASRLKNVCNKVVEDRPHALEDVDVLLRESILLGGDEGKWLKDIFEKLQLKNPSPLLLEYLELAKQCKLSVTDLRINWMRFDQFRQAMMAFMKQYDVILCPVAATPAKAHGRSFKEVADFSYSMCYSLTSWPAGVVRCGMSKEGLPIGVQIIAKPWREDVVLGVASYLEQEFGGWSPPNKLGV